MGKTALEEALKRFDVATTRAILEARPELRNLRLGNGFDLLQFCCRRPTAGDRAAARRQLRLAQWLVDEQGFDPTVLHMTAPGDDGEAEPTQVSLAFFAVAAAQNNELARYFLARGARPNAIFAAVWWGNAEILDDLVRHGADINEVVEATPLHMAVDILQRGVERQPSLEARRMSTLEQVLDLGGDPNIAATNGSTPLHTALDKGYGVDVIALLLKHGANPDAPGKDGRSVRAIAARKKDKRYAAAIQRLAPEPS